LEISAGLLSTVDMVVQRRDGPRWLREHDDDDDDVPHPPAQRGSATGIMSTPIFPQDVLDRIA